MYNRSSLAVLGVLLVLFAIVDPCQAVCGANAEKTCGALPGFDPTQCLSSDQYPPFPCPCKPGYIIGCMMCDTATAYEINVPAPNQGPTCTLCDCNSQGSNDTSCTAGGDPFTQNPQCSCKPFVTGLKCDTCEPGYSGFPNCTACPCNPTGSVPNACVNYRGASNTVACQCLDGYTGALCDSCTVGYFDASKAMNKTTSSTSGNGTSVGTTCSACQCSSYIQPNTTCDGLTGLCNCLTGYTGSSCDQCLDSTYTYPNCHGDFWLNNKFTIISVGSALAAAILILGLLQFFFRNADNLALFSAILSVSNVVTSVLFFNTQLQNPNNLPTNTNQLVVILTAIFIFPFFAYNFGISVWLVVNEVRTNTRFRDWFDNNITIGTLAVMLGITQVEQLNVMRGRFFGIRSMDAPMSDKMIGRSKVYPIVQGVGSDAPMLALKIYLLTQATKGGNKNTILVVSLAVGGISLLHNVLRRSFVWLVGKSKRNSEMWVKMEGKSGVEKEQGEEVYGMEKHSMALEDVDLDDNVVKPEPVKKKSVARRHIP